MRFEQVNNSKISTNQNNVVLLYRKNTSWGIEYYLIDFSTSKALWLEEDEFITKFPNVTENSSAIWKYRLKGLNYEDFQNWQKTYKEYGNVGFWHALPAHLQGKYNGDGYKIKDRPIRCLDELIRCYEWEVWKDSQFSNMSFEDPERYNRMLDAASYGSEGSKHCEIIDDYREFLSYLESKYMIAPIFSDKIQDEIDKVEEWHIKNGSYESELG